MIVRVARAAKQATPRHRMPRQQYPHLLEMEYRKYLHAQLNLLRGVVGDLMHTLQTAPIEDATAALERARARWTAGVQRSTETLARTAIHVIDHQAKELDRQTRAVLGVPAAMLGVQMHVTMPRALRIDADIGATRELDGRVTGWIHENVSLIKSLGDTPLAEIEQVVARAYARGDRNTTLASEIVKRFGVAEDRAKVIARDQIGKLNGRVSADRHQRMGLTRFIWRDVGDRRVRPEHRHLSGTTWAYASPPSEGLPGEPIQCRCHDEPIFDDVLAELDRLEAAGAPLMQAPTFPDAISVDTPTPKKRARKRR